MELPPTARFQPFLLPGERVLWAGRPKQGFLLHRTDAFLLPFSWLWLAFVVAFFFMAPPSPSDEVPIWLFMGLFLVVGIYVAFGRFIHDAIIRKRMTYAVTDQRVLFLQGARITSLDLQRLPKLELVEHGDQRGTISFETTPTFFDGAKSANLAIWVPTIASSQFVRIQEPRRVYQLIRDHGAKT